MPGPIPPEIQTTITQAVDWLWETYGKPSFDNSAAFHVAVYQWLETHFDLSEMRDLCFKLSVEYENLRGENKRDKAREIVSYCQRHALVPQLKATLAELRPTVAWSEVEQQSPTEASYETKWRKSIEKYYTSLFERVGFVRILGRMESEPLENVFTHVNVLDKLTAEQRYDVAKLKSEFDPRDFARLERVRRVSGDEAVAEFPKLFVLGKPGAGKTTFLKYTALRAIKHEIKKVPLFVTLKELSDSGMGIVEFMTHQLAVHRFPEPEAFLERLLENGDGLVLFDGLDEVNLEDNKRSRMIRQINDFVYRYSDGPTLMTCRVAATDYSFTQFEYVEMADFDSRQMKTYIDLWFVGNEVKRENFKKVLLGDANYKPVRELAQVPLLLALLCLVYEERNEIPPERHEIYEEAMRALLSKWDASREISRDVVYQQLSLGRKQKMLAMIAAKTFEQGDYFLKEREVVQLVDNYLVGVPGLEEPDAELVLRSLEAQHGIFVERARGIHSFSHLTLQEYFTARYIVDNDKQGTVARLMTHVGDDRWREVFLLVAGMLDDATEFSELYLKTTLHLFQDDQDCLAWLNWAAQGAAGLASYRPAASRAFLHYRALNHIPAPNIKIAQDHVRAGDLDYCHNLILDLTHALDHVLDFALFCARDNDFARLDLTRDATRDIFDTLADALAEAFDLAKRLDLIGMQTSLQSVKVPNRNADFNVVRQFSHQMSSIIGSYRDQWNPYQLLSATLDEMSQWSALSDGQISLWTQYLEANLLLVRCLQVAYVPNRQALEDKILLPPDMW